MSRLSRTPRWLAPALLAVGSLVEGIGTVAPWIPHRAAGLTVGGFDLFEVSKFFPAVRTGAVSIFREGFLLPLLTSAVLFALVPALVTRPTQPVRSLFPALSAMVALLALPPYPAILTAHQDPEYRGQLLLGGTAFFLSLLSPLARRLPSRLLDGLIATLAVGGLAGGIAALASARPLFAELYGAPVDVGWGVIACGLGCATALAGAALHSGQRPQRTH